tara:strand:- start:297 stop:620 length:324 start_codon:yes stop_codon:yes gene_type:complete
MTNEEYILHIVNICNRLIDEKLIKIVEKDENGKKMIKIVIIPCEWYLELNDDDKYCVEINLQKHYSSLINKVIEELNNENKKNNQLQDEDLNEEKNEIIQSNKRQRI